MNQLQNKINLVIENQNISEQEIIDELNSQAVERLVPTIVFLSLIIIVGIPGNGLVCYIYRSNYSASSSRWFMFFLSVVNLILCVSIVPIEIVYLCYQYNFESEGFCKSSTFLGLWSVFSLGCTLLIVSIDRYRKVCRPHGWQIDLKKARILSVIAVIFGFVISLPIIHVYGIYEFDIDAGESNVTFYECSFRQTSKKSSFAFYYVVCGMAMFTTNLVTICFLYVLIGKAIKQLIHRGNIKENLCPSTSAAKRSEDNISLADNNIELEAVRILDDNLPKAGASFQSAVDNTLNEADDISWILSEEEKTYECEKPAPQVRTTKPKEVNNSNACSVRKTKARKATLSMFLISAVFVVSYLPLICLSLVKSLVLDFTDMMSDSEWAVYMFFLRAFFLNCAINPFIYGIADSSFREDCKNVIWQMRERVLRFIGSRR